MNCPEFPSFRFKMMDANASLQTNIKKSQIQAYFENKTVLITGGTGFFGNVLIEKLLRSCPGIKKIFLPVRPQKGKDTKERFAKIFSGPVFGPLTREVPDFAEKVVFVSADLSLPQCGMSAEDQELMNREINVVFHTAATVRFDLPISTAINTNTRATRDLVNMARRMHNLEAFVYVSTAYSNCVRDTIGEEFYDYRLKGNSVIHLSEGLDDEQLAKLTPFLMGSWPNSYVFSKCLAENVIKEIGEDLPIAVVRPSIVTSTAKAPILGWINNYYGPTCVCAGVYKGLLSIFEADQECAADLVPVDYVINAIIACAWDLGTRKAPIKDALKEESTQSKTQIKSASQTTDVIDPPTVTKLDSTEPKRKKRDSSVPIYNYVSSSQNKITWKRFMSINFNIVEKYPLKSAIWRPSITLTTCKIYFALQSIIFQLLPAFLADIYFSLSGDKQRFFDISQKFFQYSSITSFFSTREWKFDDSNVTSLWEKLNEADKEIFYFNIRDLDWAEYLRDYMLGIREYLLRESWDTVSEGVKNKKRFSAAQQILVLITYAILFYCVYLFFTGLGGQKNDLLVQQIAKQDPMSSTI